VVVGDAEGDQFDFDGAGVDWILVKRDLQLLHYEFDARAMALLQDFQLAATVGAYESFVDRDQKGGGSWLALLPNFTLPEKP